MDAEGMALARGIGCEHGLRTLDAIHLAADSRLRGAAACLSLDERQVRAATDLGPSVMVTTGAAS